VGGRGGREEVIEGREGGRKSSGMEGRVGGNKGGEGGMG